MQWFPNFSGGGPLRIFWCSGKHKIFTYIGIRGPLQLISLEDHPVVRKAHFGNHWINVITLGLTQSDYIKRVILHYLFISQLKLEYIYYIFETSKYKLRFLKICLTLRKHCILTFTNCEKHSFQMSFFCVLF